MSVKDKFVNMLTQAFEIVDKSNIDYVKFGVFGSFARNEFNANSDIDFVLVVTEIPQRLDVALLRSKFDDLGCDIALLLEESFNNPQTAFAKNVVRDFKEIKL